MQIPPDDTEGPAVGRGRPGQLERLPGEAPEVDREGVPVHPAGRAGALRGHDTAGNNGICTLLAFLCILIVG